jgi:hypothetical protein
VRTTGVGSMLVSVVLSLHEEIKGRAVGVERMKRPRNISSKSLPGRMPAS